MSLDQQYAAQIALEATLIMVRETKRTTAHYCREAQALRCQIEGRA
jgi:hypothetical protein